MPRQRHTSSSSRPALQGHLPIPNASKHNRSSYRKRINLRLALFTFLLCVTLALLFINSTIVSRYDDLTLYADSAYASGPSAVLSAAPIQRLTYDTRNFTLDGKPIRIISGSVHYFRLPPSQWRPVLELARDMGLNAIETYVPWNLHEPVRGKYTFSGIRDLRRFLEEAQTAGLLVLLRPGPYICSEWDLGGLPPYLLKDPSMRLRSSYKPFLEAAKRYISVIAKVVAPYIGRPVVALQLENEFGGFGNDPAYMTALRDEWRKRGFSERNLMLFTSDNVDAHNLRQGSPFKSSQVLKTINFGGHADERLAALRSIQPDAPAMVTELWTGWFDHWGESHHTRDGEKVAAIIENILFHHEASLNLYMFFGGSNFGFMAGANTADNGTYQPDTTSYDYDAFVTESGEVRSSKFFPVQRVLRRFWKMQENHEMVYRMEEPVSQSRTSAYAGPVALTGRVPLFDVLDHVADAHENVTHPMPIEPLGGTYGYSLYRTTLTSGAQTTERAVVLSGVRDFAYVIADGHVIQTVDRNREHERVVAGRPPKTVMIPGSTKRLDVFVEHSGRVNYGRDLHDRKGLLANVTVDGSVLSGFEVWSMSFPEDHEMLRDVLGRHSVSMVRAIMAGRADATVTADSPPMLFHGTLSVNPGSRNAMGGELPGTWVRVFGRGALWINGFNIGRFHTGVSGPQRSLFVPGSLLTEGVNDVVVLHTNMQLVRSPYKVQFFEQPDFGQ